MAPAYRRARRLRRHRRLRVRRADEPLGLAFIAGGSAIGWDQAASVGTDVHRYVTYYVVTSLAWDTFRAIGNAALVIVLGRPLLGALDRAARRMCLHVTEPQPAAPDGINA
jgi:hypothetical protein